MEIKWLGHSCFLIRDSSGKKILTDPFDNSVGYKLLTEPVDIVTISHCHFDHNFIANLPNSPYILDKVGYYSLCNVKINGLPSYHDKVKGLKRGKNIIFIFEVDGYRLCHLGDLGHLLSDETIDLLGNVDVLFIPVGGNYTLNGKEAGQLSKKINSHIIIPMHYKTPALKFPLDGVEEFLIYMKNGEKFDTNTLIIEKTLNEYNQIKILDYI